MRSSSRRTRWTILVATVVAVVFAGSFVVVASAANSSPSSFVATSPLRVLDTRPSAILGPNETRTLSLAANVPIDATAVAINVTVTGGTTASWLTVYPTGSPLPFASSLNWSDSGAHPNAITVQLGTDRSISIHNASGSVHVLVDLNGYFVPTAPTTSLPSAGNWGVNNRNTVGSPVTDLRSGPLQPPVGEGSLNLSVATGEKVTYGNEQDFALTPFAVTAVGFYVFNLTENIDNGPNNMPQIAFEIDPNLETFPADNFSTLVFLPPVSLPGWSDYIDGTTSGLWGLSGSEFDGVPCGLNSSLCSWTDLQAFLNDGGEAPTLLSVALTKGSDLEWHGAVDGLRINDTVYDFEEHGVAITAP
jgi:hypothetical protein